MEEHLCECGCGEAVTAKLNSHTGRPVRFRKGHWTRLGGSILHTPDAKARRKVSRAASERARWPTKEDIESALEQFGSRCNAARNLKMHPEKLRRIIREYGIEHTPAANAMPKTHMRFAFAGEEHAAMILGAELFRPTEFRDAPYDLRWCGLRVNVKTGRVIAGSDRAAHWAFSTHGRGGCDVYFCIACDKDGMPLRYFLIPHDVAAVLSVVNIPATLRGKWMRYEWRPQPSEPPTNLQTTNASEFVLSNFT